jgi:hypothetical protein
MGEDSLPLSLEVGMARIFVEGFESGDSGMWTNTGTFSVAASPPVGMSGAYYGVLSSIAAYARKSFSTSYSEIYLAVKFRYANAYADIMEFFDSAGVCVFSLGRTAAAKLQCYRGTTGTGTAIGSVSTLILTLNQIYLLEIYYKPLDANGLATVKVDGTTEITIAVGDALDTTNGLQNVQSVGFGAWTGSNAINAIDDLVVDSASWIGNTRITAIAPTGAGATTGWTPSAGANYTTVDEKPASDADYISTNTANAIDTYVMGNPTSSVGSIKSVIVQSRNWRTGNGAVGMLKHVVRPVSTDRVGATVNGGAYIPISATAFQTIWETNPDDAAAWEIADVEGMEAGVKAVTA